jgi:hypothetical protein
MSESRSYLDALRREQWVIDNVSMQTGRDLVRRYHYAKGASNTRVYLHGLFRSDNWIGGCMGVAWWIPPTRSAAEATHPDNWKGVLSLSRVVLHPDAPHNSASFLVSQSMRRIDRDRWPCLVTYADEWQGHTGKIYKATNWKEVGRTKPQRTYVVGDRMVSRKAGPKTRTHKEMLDIGARCLGSFARVKFIHLKLPDDVDG